MARYTSKERYWLTREGDRVVKDGHPDAASLYVAPGHEVDEDDAKRLGLLELDTAEPDAGGGDEEGATEEGEESEEAADAEAPAEEAGPTAKAIHKASVQDKGLRPAARRYAPPAATRTHGKRR
jgi:hypothetical protein